MQVNVDPGQDLVFFRVKISCIVFPASARVCIYSGTLHKTSVREKRCLFANRLSFSELFDDISLILNVRRLCVVGIVLSVQTR